MKKDLVYSYHFFVLTYSRTSTFYLFLYLFLPLTMSSILTFPLFNSSQSCTIWSNVLLFYINRISLPHSLPNIYSIFPRTRILPSLSNSDYFPSLFHSSTLVSCLSFNNLQLTPSLYSLPALVLPPFPSRSINVLTFAKDTAPNTTSHILSQEL